MFYPDQFWQYAQSLSRRPSLDECDARVAAGRAYYAFFLTVRSRLTGVQFRQDASDHGTAVLALRRQNKVAKASQLRILGRIRHRADYELQDYLARKRSATQSTPPRLPI